MINKIRLNDGTEMDRTAAQEKDPSLWIYVYDIRMDLEEARELLTDPEKTAVITDVQESEEIPYVGYTVLHQLSRDICGVIAAEMRRE